MRHLSLFERAPAAYVSGANSPESSQDSSAILKGNAVLDFLSQSLGQKTLVQLRDVPRAVGVSSDRLVLETSPPQLS